MLEVDVVFVLVDEVDVEVDVLVDVEVVLVVVSHAAQVLAHCLATNSSSHSPPAYKRSHLSSEKMLAFPAHL